MAAPWLLLLLVVAAEGSSNDTRCQDGLLLPRWMPQENLTVGDRIARGLVYFFAMIYLFIGVSIISDRFMAAIEVITSQEKEIRVKNKRGETQILVVRVWNETVANLTLMALGSSAPEILLSVIEIMAKNFEAGDLGPGTIVGSAAYNLFVIIAICVLVIPEGEVRKIKHLRVFFVTATWSVFAYVWLYLILSVISPGRVDVWEALLTFAFFPMTVATAYIADRRLLIYKYLHKNYRMNRRGVIVEAEGDVELAKANHVDGALRCLEQQAESEEVQEFEKHRRDYISTLRELRKAHPTTDLDQLEVMAQEQVLNKGPKSRAFYRIQATRKMVGGGNIMKKIQERAQSDLSEVKAELQREEDLGTRVFFDPGHYTVMENVGEFEVRVVREGGDPGCSLMVDYETEDGSANAGSDYVGARGTLVFHPGETCKTFRLQVIDDDVFEEDEHFYVRLSNLRAPGPPRRLSARPPPAPQLGSPSLATVMILDDDHGGVFGFAERDVELVESAGLHELRVVRYSGARGRVAVCFSTQDGTAKAGKEYEALSGEVVFDNNQSEVAILLCRGRGMTQGPKQTIPLRIIDEDSYEKDVLFYVNLEELRMLGDEARLVAEAESKRSEDLTMDDKMALLGRPRLGENTRAQIRIKESKEFKNTVDKLVQRANASLLIGTSSWKEQFIEAITVSPGDDSGGEGDEEKLPSCGDYVMHFVTLLWKLLFAFVPPTEMLRGYACFFASIFVIGVVTAVIGDVASHFGCTLGMLDSITAIVFVALGTSIPDMLNGYVCFVVSIFGVGCLTAVIGDVASHFGCTVGLKDAVTAIAFVALGTSVPDTFASKVAAIQDKYADASIGNVTGSNAVNVFLGIGVAWSLAALVHAARGTQFLVDPGNMAFSVTIFCSEALLAILLLVARRSKLTGGELGGPLLIKYFTGGFLISLWIVYIVLSSLEVYDVIEGF